VAVTLQRGAFAAALILSLALTAPGICVDAAAQTSKSNKTDKPKLPKPANIDRNGVLILVRTAILALDQANKTGNYTVLRDLGSPAFQKNTAARLAEIFAGHRKDGLDFGGLAVLDPQLTLMPQIEPNGMLHMAGFFPSVPSQVNFELLFAPVERQWKLFGISVNLTKGGPAAPETPPGPAEPVVTNAVEPDAPTTGVGPQTEAEPPKKP